MKAILKKLNIKKEREILVLNLPDEFDRDFHTLEGITITESLVQLTKTGYALLFIADENQLEKQFETLELKLKDDATLWVAYPSASEALKQSHPWQPLAAHCFEEVEATQINKNWNAKRFRKLEYLHCAEKTNP